MKMVSAAKLKRASDAIIGLRPYAVKLKELLDKIAVQLESVDSPFLQARPVNKLLVVSITSNRGQAGAFNSNIIKASLSFIASDFASFKGSQNVSMLAIGRKGFDYFTRRKHHMLENFNDIYLKLEFSAVASIANMIIQGYEEGRWDRVELIYNHYKNAAVQVVTQEVLLPLGLGDTSAPGGSPAIAPGSSTARAPDTSKPAHPGSRAAAQERITEKIPFYIFEPSPEEIVKRLIPEAIRIQLYKALLDSHAAEHGARMTSMEKATENAGELLKTYRLQYNRARQAAITTEILEIVSGANALSGN